MLAVFSRPGVELGVKRNCQGFLLCRPWLRGDKRIKKEGPRRFAAGVGWVVFGAGY